MGLVRVQGHSVIVKVSDCKLLDLPSGGFGVEELGAFGSEKDSGLLNGGRLGVGYPQQWRCRSFLRG